MKALKDITGHVFRMITVRGRQYPAHKLGDGPTPIFFTGIGSNVLKTVSPEFLEDFTVYSCDFYWVKDQKLDESDLATITMPNLAEDTVEAIKQLGLDKMPGGYMVGGNSIWGTLAIETAKLKPEGLKGVLAIAPPTYWTAEGSPEGNAHREANASPERKAEFDRRMAEYEASCSPEERSEVDPPFYYACLPNYIANYETISKQANADLWHGALPDAAAINRLFVEHLVHEYGHDGLRTGMENIEVPVGVFAGEHDYDCYPKGMWAEYAKPKTFNFYHNPNAGHWPHWEDSDQFMKDIKAWRAACKLTPELDPDEFSPEPPAASAKFGAKA